MRVKKEPRTGGSKLVARSAANLWSEELFADLLGRIHVRSSTYFRPTLRVPWGWQLEGGFTAFHVVARGTCWIEIRGLPKPLKLSAGDFVVVPRGTEHVMLNPLGTRPVDFFDLAKAHGPSKNRAFSVGGKGSVTELVCGGMQFENNAAETLLAALPPLIHVRGRDGGAQPWLRAAVAHLLEALESDGPGRQTVFARLADILFIQAVRAYLNQNADLAQSGWLAALRDKRIGEAIALLHSKPEQRWAVAALADRLGLSRSAFAERFSRFVGESPHQYLARLRLNIASERLRNSGDQVAAIARSAGYTSLAAFSKAFKRHQGASPAAYRKIQTSLWGKEGR